MNVIVNNLPYIIISGTTLIIGVVYAIVKISLWAGAVNADRETFNNFMLEVREDIKLIIDRLDHKVTTWQSPKQLTDMGKEVSRSIGDKAFIEELAQEHHKKLKFKSRYQIQSFCENLIMYEYEPDAEVMTRMEDCAFDRGLDMRHIHLVVSVLLRDRIFELLGKAPG